MGLWKKFKNWLLPPFEDEIETYEDKPKEKKINRNVQIILFKPRSFEDVQFFSTHLLNGKVIVVNLNKLKLEVSQRVLDFISGVLFASKGTIYQVEDSIYLFAPKDVKVEESLIEQATKM